MREARLDALAHSQVQILLERLENCLDIQELCHPPVFDSLPVTSSDEFTVHEVILLCAPVFARYGKHEHSLLGDTKFPAATVIARTRLSEPVPWTSNLRQASQMGW